MVTTAFVHGLTLSVGLIAAVGPQNVFVFQQGATQPRLRRSLPTVLTAGVADTVLILGGVLGVSAVVIEFAWLQTVLLGSGVVFLIYVGWTLLSAPATALDSQDETRLGVREQVGFTASVSLLNPHAILDTIGVIGTNALAYASPGRWAFTAACLLVSWAWFLGLAAGGRLLGSSVLSDDRLRYLNVISAGVIWIVALYMAWRLLALVGVR
ncbi:Transporter, LysE family [Halorubrum sp. DM2]|uniref:LysE/ArgO family amino acid transporter n=1 Tax=unclassified Halorubrum TaxID=2642239 RepID=UPI0003DC6B2D|nr:MULTISPECIES: LysE family transporter [unclassified Halorubrum]CDK38419.1 lysE family transporter protein [Halorubrum sp. AJ67]VTT85951.1 Transporter, LysE family [Halorubrum sp. DM2]